MDDSESTIAEGEELSMLPIATEVFTVTEQNPGEYVSLINDEFFQRTRVKNPNEYLKAMLLLGREKLLREIASADRNRVVEQTPHRSFKSSLFSISFLLDENMQLIVLTYFGEKTPPETNYAEALVHVLEVVSILESDLNVSIGGPSRSFGTLGSVIAAESSILAAETGS